MSKTKRRIVTTVVALGIAFTAISITSRAAMYFDVYASLTSGNWNPFITDVASTYGFVGWENQNIRDNYGNVKATIYWQDGSGNDRTTSNTLDFSDVAGKTKTVSADSGNDDSTASSYHYGYLYDNLSGRAFSASGNKEE